LEILKDVEQYILNIFSQLIAQNHGLHLLNSKNH